MKRAQLFFWPLFFAAAAVALIQGGRLPYLLFYLCCGLFTFSLLYIVGVRLLVRVDVLLPRRYISSGQSLKWQVAVYSRFFLPIPAFTLWFHFGDHQEGPETLTLPVPPYRGGSREIEHRFTCRGRYSLGVKRWRVPDYLALFWAGRRELRAETVDVLPRILPLETSGDGRPLIETNTFDSEAHPEFDGIRPYDVNDVLRSIHWKLSAKSDDFSTGGDFMVKKTSNLLPRSVYVVVDMTAVSQTGPLGEALEDKLLETAFSLIRHLLYASRVETVVLSDEIHTQPLTTLSEFVEFYHHYGLAPFETGQLANLIPDIPPKADLWVVSTHLHESLFELLRYHPDDDADAGWLHISAEEVVSFAERKALGAMETHGVSCQVLLLDEDIRDAAFLLQEP